MREAILFLVFAIIASAQPSTAWRISAGTLVAATAVDAASSWGGVELNPILAGADHRFSARGAAIKGSVAAATILIQWAILRHHPRAAKLFAIVNFGASGAYVGVAARNWRISR